MSDFILLMNRVFLVMKFLYGTPVKMKRNLFRE